MLVRIVVRDRSVMAGSCLLFRHSSFDLGIRFGNPSCRPWITIVFDGLRPKRYAAIRIWYTAKQWSGKGVTHHAQDKLGDRRADLHSTLCNAAYTDEAPEVHGAINLSPDTLMLLQAEMRELAVAGQAMAIHYVSGDWRSIQQISEQIRASYVMERKLSDAQKQELEDRLPERFKNLDADFHARADRLKSAAANANSELIAFHYYRLLESCATCHSEFAASRFPGSSLFETDIHQH